MSVNIIRFACAWSQSDIYLEIHTLATDLRPIPMTDTKIYCDILGLKNLQNNPIKSVFTWFSETISKTSALLATKALHFNFSFGNSLWK